MESIDASDFIRENLRLLPVPFVPEISLYTAHPASGLWRLAEPDRKPDAPPPYWAYQWAGGLALARYLLDWPGAVAGKRVLDLGAGSGIVAIVAATAGAQHVIAADIDPNAIAAIGFNAAANHVTLEPVGRDLLDDPLPLVDLVVVGDLFYDETTSGRLTAFLDRCLDAGMDVLIGDPYRAHLPAARLRLIVEYALPGFGDKKDARSKPGGVFALEPRKADATGS